MDLTSPPTQLSLAALIVAVIALGVSSSAAFPGLKSLLLVVRDGVLWLALFFVVGGAGFVIWQRLEQARPAAAAPTKNQLESRQNIENPVGSAGFNAH